MQAKRLIGIDSIRFVCAFVVVLSHYGGPPVFSYINTDSVFFLKVISGIYNNLFFGVAAVIVFFVISGLVIHYPYADGKKPTTIEFYLKRYTRILIPLIAASWLNHLLKAKLELVVWSLYAELIYYTLYPILLVVKSKTGWTPMIIISFILTISLYVFITPIVNDGIYHSFGIYYTWVIGLPCWLLGVKLAEEVKNASKKVTTNQVWLMRITTWIVSVGCSILYFHVHISQIILLSIFALLVFIWLKTEINYFREKSPAKWLEYCGLWSYSLYLCHYLAEAIFVYFDFAQDQYLITGWLITMGGAILFSYLFYLLIEAPSHKLSRAIKLRSNDKVV